MAGISFAAAYIPEKLSRSRYPLRCGLPIRRRPAGDRRCSRHGLWWSRQKWMQCCRRDRRSRNPVDGYIQQISDLPTDNHIERRLSEIGAPPHQQNISAARTHLIRSGAAASARVQRAFDDDVLDAPDPIAALMADLGAPSEAVQQLLRGEVHASPAEAIPSPAPTPSSQFVIHDQQTFGEVIGEILAALKDEGLLLIGMTPLKAAIDLKIHRRDDKAYFSLVHLPGGSTRILGNLTTTNHRCRPAEFQPNSRRFGQKMLAPALD